MAAKIGAVRRITLIMFIVILERPFWCLFQGTVLLIIAFVSAEREGERALHMWAVNQMTPYFYAAVHLHNIYEIR